MTRTRDDFVKECPAFGLDAEGKPGIDESSKSCQYCAANDGAMHDACKDECDGAGEIAEEPADVVETVEAPEPEAPKAKAGKRLKKEKEPKEKKPPKEKKAKKEKTPKPPKTIAEPGSLNAWRTKYHLQDGSTPCMVFDKLFDAGTSGKTEEQIGIELSAEHKDIWPTSIRATKYLHHLIKHWTEKRHYAGITIGSGGNLSLVWKD